MKKIIFGRGRRMIRLKEKDLSILGIKSVELDSKGNIIGIVGMSGRIDKIYNWAILGIEYSGG